MSNESSSSSSSSSNSSNGVQQSPTTLPPDGYTNRKNRFNRRRKTTTIRRHVTIITTDDSETDTIAPGKWEEHQEQQSREAVSSVNFFCGITAGVLQAGLFNPFDRALYLSITNDVPFLRRENFLNPYSGFMQSVGHRALSSGLYYPLENFFCSLLLSSHSHQQQQHNPARIHLHPAGHIRRIGQRNGSQSDHRHKIQKLGT